MSTNFPASLDSFPAIQPTTKEDDVGFEHDVVHNNTNDAVAALQQKVGVDASTDTASVDYRVAALEAATTYPFRADAVADGTKSSLAVLGGIVRDSVMLFKNGTVLKTDEYTVDTTTIVPAPAPVNADVYSLWCVAKSDTASLIWVDQLTLMGAFDNAHLNEPYDAFVTISGGDAVYSNARVTAGALPAGLPTLSIQNGNELHLSGTPTVDGAYSFTVAVDSGDGQTATLAVSFVVIKQKMWAAAYLAMPGPNKFAYAFDDGDFRDYSGNGYNGTGASAGFVFAQDDPNMSGGGTVTSSGGRQANMPTASAPANGQPFSAIGIIRLPTANLSSGDHHVWSCGASGDSDGASVTVRANYTPAFDGSRGGFFATSAVLPRETWMTIINTYEPGVGMKVWYALRGDSTFTLAGSTTHQLYLNPQSNYLFGWQGVRNFEGTCAFMAVKQRILTTAEMEQFIVKDL